MVTLLPVTLLIGVKAEEPEPSLIVHCPVSELSDFCVMVIGPLNDFAELVNVINRFHSPVNVGGVSFLQEAVSIRINKNGINFFMVFGLHVISWCTNTMYR